MKEIYKKISLIFVFTLLFANPFSIVNNIEKAYAAPKYKNYISPDGRSIQGDENFVLDGKYLYVPTGNDTKLDMRTLKVDKKNIRSDESVTISITPTNGKFEKVGIYDEFTLYVSYYAINSPIDYSYMNHTFMEYNPATGNYEGKVSGFNEAGVWAIEYVYIASVAFAPIKTGLNEEKTVYNTGTMSAADINVLNNAPKFSGTEDKTIKVNSPFNIMDGVTAIDDFDGNITSKVSTVGSVVVNTLGVYKVTYLATDSNGATTKVTRAITVASNVTPNPPAPQPSPNLPKGIIYQTHVQSYGWQQWKANGEMSGTTGEAKRLEGIKIQLNNSIPGASISYRTHVQTYGWQGWKSNGEMSGTSGQAKRLEAIEIKLNNAPGYSVEYRVHVQGYGWQGWKKDGQMAGTSGEARRLEGIEIRIVNNYDTIGVQYRTHVQTYGWQDWSYNGAISGTTGKAKRLEGIEMMLTGAPKGARILYQTHVQSYGWQKWMADGQMSGTSGKAKRLEAIKIKLENAPGYKIEYRVHVQSYGWQNWVSDGQVAGTTGQGKRLEAIQIRIVKK